MADWIQAKLGFFPYVLLLGLFGWVFLMRAALLVAGFVALTIGNNMPIATACFAAALITLGWSGHAATEGVCGYCTGLVAILGVLSPTIME